MMLSLCLLLLGVGYETLVVLEGAQLRVLIAREQAFYAAESGLTVATQRLADETAFTEVPAGAALVVGPSRVTVGPRVRLGADTHTRQIVSVSAEIVVSQWLDETRQHGPDGKDHMLYTVRSWQRVP